MFKNRTNNTKTTTRFELITPILLIMLLIAWGCSNSDNMMLVPTAELDSEITENILAAPGNPPPNEIFNVEGTIGFKGGQLTTEDGTTLFIPKKALSEETDIIMKISAEMGHHSNIDLKFDPRNLPLAKPARLEFSWSTLEGLTSADLRVYYFDGATGDWLAVEVEFDDVNRKAVFETEALFRYQIIVLQRYYTEAVIGKKGGQLTLEKGTKLIIPEGALTEDVPISMEVISDGIARIDFHFGPHGTFFEQPVEIKMSWATLKSMNVDNLVLYYNDDVNGWQEESQAEFNKQHKSASVYVNHFSEYYFNRR
ncbi:hypothetical protein H8E77_39965 [bacterium]|nr:hypothetical protein [bacterium]